MIFSPQLKNPKDFFLISWVLIFTIIKAEAIKMVGEEEKEELIAAQEEEEE